MIRGVTVEKNYFELDIFLDFYGKIMDSNNSNYWIDRITNGGLVANLDIDLSNNSLKLENLLGLASISILVEKFENISGTFNSDNLTGNDLNNVLLGKAGDDFILGKKVGI